MATSGPTESPPKRTSILRSAWCSRARAGSISTRTSGATAAPRALYRPMTASCRVFSSPATSCETNCLSKAGSVRAACAADSTASANCPPSGANDSSPASLMKVAESKSWARLTRVLASGFDSISLCSSGLANSGRCKSTSTPTARTISLGVVGFASRIDRMTGSSNRKSSLGAALAGAGACAGAPAGAGSSSSSCAGADECCSTTAQRQSPRRTSGWVCREVLGRIAR